MNSISKMPSIFDTIFRNFLIGVKIKVLLRISRTIFQVVLQKNEQTQVF
tara:strand:- start:6584 stop:6730 length:147 start_codon:yes stop_codon:yes gene_type:complete